MGVAGLLAILWIFKRRSDRKKGLVHASKGRYSTLQIFGIVGILFFLLPIFYTAISYLNKGALILILFVFGLVHVPKLLVTLIMYVLIPAAFFINIAGSYMLCEYIWPKKEGKDALPIGSS